MAEKSFAEVMERFRTVAIDERFDLIVAVASGGVVPAGILAQRLASGGVAPEMRLLHINLRDERQCPRYDSPRLLSPVDFEFVGRRVLLVDDRVKSGATVRMARELLAGAAVIRTFAVNGAADYSLYDEPCFRMPWIL